MNPCPVHRPPEDVATENALEAELPWEALGHEWRTAELGGRAEKSQPEGCASSKSQLA